MLRAATRSGSVLSRIRALGLQPRAAGGPPFSGKDSENLQKVTKSYKKFRQGLQKIAKSYNFFAKI
jgi:hypothetical protein